MRRRYYVVQSENGLKLVRQSVKPEHSVGPFRTKRGAAYKVANPDCKTIAEAERGGKLVVV